jgi:aminomethyltransferase
MEAGSRYGILPAGLLALDVARNEAGLILLDVDYVSARHALIDAQFSSPFEVNLGWAVAKDKPPFVGQRPLMKERENPSGWRFVGVDVDWESLERLYNSVGLPPRLPTTAWRASVPIYKSGKQVGYATSGCWSPVLKKYIALAHVQNVADGTAVEFEVTVEHRRNYAAAKIVKLPFFDPPRTRA